MLSGKRMCAFQIDKALENLTGELKVALFSRWDVGQPRNMVMKIEMK